MNADTGALVIRVHDAMVEWDRVADEPTPEREVGVERDPDEPTRDAAALEAAHAAIAALEQVTGGPSRNLRAGLLFQVVYGWRERGDLFGSGWPGGEEAWDDTCDALVDLYRAFEIEIHPRLAEAGPQKWEKPDPRGALEAVRGAAKEIVARVGELGPEPWSTGLRGVDAQRSLMEQAELLAEREWELERGAHALAARRAARAIRMMCRARVIGEIARLWAEVGVAGEGLVEAVR